MRSRSILASLARPCAASSPQVDSLKLSLDTTPVLQRTCMVSLLVLIKPSAGLIDTVSGNLYSTKFNMRRLFYKLISALAQIRSLDCSKTKLEKHKILKEQKEKEVVTIRLVNFQFFITRLYLDFLILPPLESFQYIISILNEFMTLDFRFSGRYPPLSASDVPSDN